MAEEKQQETLKGKTGKGEKELTLKEEQKKFEKYKKDTCYGVHDNLYAIRDVADRLNILLIAFKSGAINSFRDYVALSDVARDVLMSEIDSLTGIIEELNGHFPDQAIELED